MGGILGSVYGHFLGMIAGAFAWALASDRGFVSHVPGALWFLVPGLITGGVVGLVLGGSADWHREGIRSDQE
jgi:hypothetical protein